MKDPHTLDNWVRDGSKEYLANLTLFSSHQAEVALDDLVHVQDRPADKGTVHQLLFPGGDEAEDILQAERHSGQGMGLELGDIDQVIVLEDLGGKRPLPGVLGAGDVFPDLLRLPHIHQLQTRVLLLQFLLSQLDKRSFRLAAGLTDGDDRAVDQPFQDRPDQAGIHPRPLV